MGPEPRYDWDEHNEGHVAAHRVEPAEVEEVLENDPIRIGVDASRKTQASGDGFRRESQNPRRIPEETQ